MQQNKDSNANTNTNIQHAKMQTLIMQALLIMITYAIGKPQTNK